MSKFIIFDNDSSDYDFADDLDMAKRKSIRMAREFIADCRTKQHFKTLEEICLYKKAGSIIVDMSKTPSSSCVDIVIGKCQQEEIDSLQESLKDQMMENMDLSNQLLAHKEKLIEINAAIVEAIKKDDISLLYELNIKGE
jgi:hypothetical protein